MKNFEFVTLTDEPSKATRNETSKIVRVHAMRDYLRRQNQEAMTGIVEAPKIFPVKGLSWHKTRFKLNSWTHKTREKAINERQSKKTPSKPRKAKHTSSQPRVGSEEESAIYSVVPSPFLPAVSGSLDPFDSLSVKLGPLSQRLLVHCECNSFPRRPFPLSAHSDNTSYWMNSIAVNSEGNFFSFVKTDPALFHSILYLVASHYNLKHGLTDSPECLYHGSEAFRLINQRLDDSNGGFSDMTLAAVAMLSNKEVSLVPMERMHV